MAGMEGLGRLFNVVPAATGLYINMKDCSSVTFICTSASTDTFNVAEAKTSGGGSVQDVGNVISRYYSTTDTDGSVAWTKQTQAAADEVASVATGSVVAIWISGSMLDDGFDYVSCTASSTGTVIAILHDLTVARTPANLSLPGE
jgi:hypothetical protein